MQASIISTMFAPLFGATAIVADKHGEKTNYKVARLSDKLGTMKNGEKAEYVVLVREDNDSITMTLHPEAAKRLAKNGNDAGIELIVPAATESTTEQAAQEPVVEAAQEPVEEQPATEQTAQEPVVEAAPEVPSAEGTATGEQPTAEAPAAAAPKELSKKARTLAVFKSMTAEGKARKDIIKVMMEEIGLSAAGANTYFQNCKSGLWK